MDTAWRRRRVGWCGLLVWSSSFALAFAGGVNYPNVIPVDEVPLGHLVGQVPGTDFYHLVLSKSNGEIALLTLESNKLKSAYSNDSGATFGAEVVIDDDVVTDYEWGLRGVDYLGPKAFLASDGTLYVVSRRGDPGGDVGVRFHRSDDMGRTWRPEVDIVKRSDPTHGVGDVLGIAAIGAGRVAVLYRSWWYSNDTYVIASSDRGVTWTTPVRLDTGEPAGGSAALDGDVAVASSGEIHAVFVQDRGTGKAVWYARSLDGGLTFGSERSFDALLPTGERTGSEHPDVEVASDGSISIAFWDNYSGGRFYVVRSTDSGATFVKAHQAAAASTKAPTPHIHVAPGTPIQLISLVPAFPGKVALHRSANYGATYTALTPFTSWAHHCTVTRTAAGKWAIAYDDERNDANGWTFTDVYVRVSADGATWGTEQRADRAAGGMASSNNPIIVAGSGENLFVAWIDGRLQKERSYDVYVNRSLASPLNLVNERRADVDTELDNVLEGGGAHVAADGVNHVYAAFRDTATGPWGDAFVAVSADRGRTFGTPQRVSTSDPGMQYVDQQIYVNAYPDGTVYLFFPRYVWGVGWDLVFRRSTDFGSTWSDEQILVPSFGALNEIRLASTSTGRVYAVWNDPTTIWLARSADGGQTWTVSDVDQDDRGNNWVPRLCAQGDQVVLSYRSYDLAGVDTSFWGTVSGDSGATWSAKTQLRPDSAASTVDYTNVVCDGAGGAIATWTDMRNPAAGEIYVNRYDGGTWLGDVPLSTSSLHNQKSFNQIFAGEGKVLVAYGNDDGTWMQRSLDGGVTFQPAVPFDEANPLPGQAHPAFLATDGIGNVWATYCDRSAGAYSVVARHSPDRGASWGVPYRMHREQPQGVRAHNMFDNEGTLGSPIAALPGTAFVLWAAEHPTTAWWDTLINVYDIGDLDRDGMPTASDCNDRDFGAWRTPIEVGGFVFEKVAGIVRLSWSTQAVYAGSGTRYDLVTGDLGQLRATSGFSGATCLVAGSGEPPFDDLRAGPDPGLGYYYLLKARNSCWRGTFGDSGHAPDPRDALDDAALCP